MPNCPTYLCPLAPDPSGHSDYQCTKCNQCFSQPTISQTQQIAAMMRANNPRTKITRRKSSLPVVFCVLVCAAMVTAFWVTATLPKAPDQKPNFIAVVTGQLPQGVPVLDVRLIRKILKSQTPTGKFEEIEWESKPSTTILHYRTENQFGGMSRQWIKLMRSRTNEDVAIHTQNQSYMLDPTKYDEPKNPVRPTTERGRLPL